MESVIDIQNDGSLDWFDSQFAIGDVESALKEVKAETKININKAKELAGSAFCNYDDEKKYYVNMGDDIKKALESGEVQFVKGKNGEIYAQLRNLNGQFGNKLSITEEFKDAGLSFEELQLSVQMEEMADKLGEIIELLKTVESLLHDAKIDRQNDRRGLFYSGFSLYLEARQISDEFLRKQVMAQALKSINDSNYQMIQDIRTNIEYLTTGQYKRKKNSKELIDEKINTIKQCYEIVYKSTMLKAMIYKESNEIAAMVTTLDEYGRFYERMINPYIWPLSELDKNSQFFASGPWGKIAYNSTALKLASVNMLSKKETIVIEMGEG